MQSRTVLFFLSILFSVVTLSHGVELQIGLVYSLTRIEGEGPDALRVHDESFTINLLSTIALFNLLNEGEDTAVRKEFGCSNITFELTVIDTVSDFSITLVNMEATGVKFDYILLMGRSSTCVPVSFVTSTANIPIISSSCTSPELDNAVSHRFFARTIPSDESVAKSLIELARVLPTGERAPIHPLGIQVEAATTGYTKIAVLYQEDVYGSEFKDAIFENAPNTIDLELIPFTVSDAASIRAAVSSAKRTGFNVFICMIFLDDMASLVEAAIEEDLMNEDKLWIFTDGVIPSADIVDIGDINLLKALNNSFIVLADGQVSAIKNNLTAFRNTMYVEEEGYDREQFKALLAPSETLTVEGTDISLEKSFSDLIDELFNNSNRGFTDFALYAYDAVLTIMEAYELNQCRSLAGVEFMETIKGSEFIFQGLTGIVNFDEDSASRDDGSAAMKMLNMRFFEEDDNTVRGEDFNIGGFSESWNISEDILFAGGNSSAPLNFDPPEKVVQFVIEEDVRNIAYVIGALLLFVAFGLIIFVHRSAEVEVIAAAQPFFLFTMLLGIMLSTAAVFPMYLEPRNTTEILQGFFSEERFNNNLRCNLPLAMVSLGVTLSYASLIFKLQRLIWIWKERQKGLNQGKVSARTSLKYMFTVLLLNFLIAGFLALYNPLLFDEKVLDTDEFEQAIETYNICVPEKPEVVSLYGLYAVFYVFFFAYGIRLVVQGREISDYFNEGRWISISILALLQLFLLGVPVVIAIGPEDPNVRFLVIALLVLLSNSMLMILIFVPKAYRIFTGRTRAVWDDDIGSNRNRPIKSYSDSEDEELEISKKDQEVRNSLGGTVATADLFDEQDDEADEEMLAKKKESCSI